MLRVRVILLSSLAAFALSVVVASTASAAELDWWVAGKALEGKEPLAEETKVTEPFRLKATGKSGSFTIECEEVGVKHGAIEAPNKRSEEAVNFEKCIVVGKPECTIAAVKTKPLKAVLEGSSGAVKLKFEPQSGTEIAAFMVEGATCIVAGSYTATGKMICKYEGVETESKEHPLEFTAGSGSKVEVDGEPAALTVTYKVHLASNKLWSVL